MTLVTSPYTTFQVAWLLAEHMCAAHHIEVILPTYFSIAPRVTGYDSQPLTRTSPQPLVFVRNRDVLYSVVVLSKKEANKY